MGKTGKTGEIKKPAAEAPAGNKPEAPKKEGGAPSHGGGTHQSASPRGAVGTKVGCHAVGCKDKDTRINFCEEHFRQFKFGLITKTGEKVLDFEKKLEHYQRWLKSQQVA